MKAFISILFTCVFILACRNSKKTVHRKEDIQQKALAKNDTVKISNNALEYEIIIIEPGFNMWLLHTAKPEGFYSQHYLETLNYQYVIEWNQRVIQPQYFNPDLYEMQINYKANIDYGYEVNYKLYNYFIYFQLTYNQRLGPYNPRI